MATAKLSNTAVLLANVPVVNGITAADFVIQPAVSKTFGKFKSTEIQGLIAQAAKSAGQSADTVSNTTGVGQFGFTPTQLESVGYLKPDTVSRFLADSTDIVTVLSSPSVWSGKNGVASLEVLLADSRIQSTIQYELLQLGLVQLTSTGTSIGNVAINNLNSQELGGIVQASAKYGAAVTSQWIKGQAPSSIVTNIKIIARSGEYAVYVVDSKFPENIKGQETPTSVSGTVTLTTLSDNVTKIIGNDKI